MFVKTTRKIAEYVSSRLKDASEFRNAMDPDNLAFDTLTAPAMGDAPTLTDVEIWKIEYKAFSEATKRRELLLGQVFAIVLGQCSPTVVDRLKSNATWDAINGANDLIGLLRLIRTSMYTGATSKNPLQSLLEAQTKFLSFRQTARMTNAEYLRSFTALSDQVLHLHGDLGTDQTYVTARIVEDGGDPADMDTRATMTLTIREEYLAMMFFTHADAKRFGSLVATAQNDYVSGIDKYPKTVSKAYDMLVNFVNPNRSHGIDDQDGGMSFYQDGSNRNPGRGGQARNNPGGRGRGAGGNRSTGSGNNDEDNHANVEAADEDSGVGSATNNSTQDDAYLTQSSFNIECIEHLVLRHDLPRMWLLLDSCSTTDIFANASLLRDIQSAPTPVWIRCNAGRVKLTQQGMFGNYPHPVWYNPKGVANILSLANVTKNYRVTMDSTESAAMFVHKSNGNFIKFEPSGTGLYKHELPADTSNINDMWSLLSNVPTVADNASKYTKRAYKGAVEARRLQNIIMTPASRKYKEVILDYLRDSKVTKADITAADHIFGPNLGALKGKTVHRPNPHVASGVDAIPPDVIKMHRHLTLTVDIMFINRLPFLVTKTRALQFTTVEFMKNRQVATVHQMLQSVLNLYTNRGFVIDAIFADYEFEALRPWHPNLNTAAADEHVPDIERQIRTIKDSTRSTYRMLPFRRIPRIMLIHLVKTAVFWLNAVPTNDGITQRYSPRYILTGQHVLASKHAVIPFGAYVQTHEPHTNDMGQRTASCICLGPTGNTQGGHYFMSLTSGDKIVRHRWTELPMPREAITRVNTIARRQKMPSTITYANRQGAEILDYIEDYADDHDSDSDDDTYSQPDDASDNDSVLSADTDTSDNDSDTNSDDDSSDDSSSDSSNDDDNDYNPPALPTQGVPTIHAQGVPLFPRVPPALAANQGVDINIDAQQAHDPNEFDDFAPNADEPAMEENDNNPVNDEDEDMVSNDQNYDTGSEDENNERMTESDIFRLAETHGRTQATEQNAMRPRREIRARRYDDFNYTFFEGWDYRAHRN